MTTIRLASTHDAEKLARVVAEAFDKLAITRWLVPDEADRRRILPENFLIFVQHGLEHGTVYTTEAGDAAAVWFSEAPAGVPSIPDYDARVAAACGEYAPRFHALDTAMHDTHPTEPAHGYLALLAVLPGAQGSGVGAALLDEHHRALDRSRTPAYLEASSARSRELYLRHGYRDVGEPFTVPPDGPEPAFWPLWREPQ